MIPTGSECNYILVWPQNCNNNFPQHYFFLIIPDFSHVPWLSPNILKIPWHFPVFQTSGHPDEKQSYRCDVKVSDEFSRSLDRRDAADVTDPLLMSAVSRPLGGREADDLPDTLLTSTDDRPAPRLADRLLLSADSETGFFSVVLSSNIESSSSSRLVWRRPGHRTSTQLLCISAVYNWILLTLIIHKREADLLTPSNNIVLLPSGDKHSIMTWISDTVHLLNYYYYNTAIIQDNLHRLAPTVRLEGFAGAKFYSPHASIVLPAPSPTLTYLLNYTPN